ncbi:hypothetical protein H1P_6500002 [Hyella patelloides LEGE 07179]|uniref:Uncharacterized protein n=1 Tax=Hyella patelloides LEGE 07179 TaxID=945734 RepID=A0A563W2M1_9CYAN|nr:hypothetical protein H1P_6500002 [Hyella patelloides LEGE 07179]
MSEKRDSSQYILFKDSTETFTHEVFSIFQNSFLERILIIREVL